MHTAASKREIRHLIPQKTTVRLSDPGISNGSLFLFQIKTGIFKQFQRQESNFEANKLINLYLLKQITSS